MHIDNGSGIPYGTIRLWYGEAGAVPAGFAICDGTNGTPDLRGRVPVGVDTVDSDFDTVGKIGGEKEHVLLVSEIAAHDHTLKGTFQSSSDYTRVGGGWSGNSTQTITANAVNDGGGNGAHNNLQPYACYHWIMKV